MKPRRKPAAKSAVKGAIRLPARLVDTWLRMVLAEGRLPRGTNRTGVPLQDLARLIARAERRTTQGLWETFTQNREELSSLPLNSQRFVVSYLLGFHLANAARMTLALQRLEGRVGFARWLGATRPQVITNDLGCGTGALTQAFADACRSAGLPADHLTAHLSDRAGLLLDAARKGLETLGATAKVVTHRCSIEDISPAKLATGLGPSTLQVFLMGYVWNEIRSNASARRVLLTALKDSLTHNRMTLTIVLESANSAECRATMELREMLAQEGHTVLYPCPASTPCPMLARHKDWCFSEGLWERPQLQAEIDRGLEIDRSHVASTIFAFASPALAEALKRQPDTRPVVVGRPLVAGPTERDRKSMQYLLCSPQGLSTEPSQPRETIVLRGLHHPTPGSQNPRTVKQ